MPVNTVHPSYAKNIPKWKKCRDFIDGEEAVKAPTTDVLYLPMLDDQEQKEYDAYKMRAMFYGASARTVAGLTGAIMRKPATQTIPEKLEEILKTVGSSGQSFQQIAKSEVTDVIGIGRIGLLVDAPQEENAVPSIHMYWAENIVNWEEQVIDGKKQPVRIILKECRRIPGEDQFEHKEEEIYRVLRLGTPNLPIDHPENMRLMDDERSRLVYSQEVWSKSTDPSTKKDEWKRESVVVPRMAGGKVWNEIPMDVRQPESGDLEPQNSPMLALVNVNASHYRTSADLEHGRHFCALPTPWVAGFDPKTTKLKIGSSVAWVSESTDASCGMLEFTGNGLGHLQTAMTEKEKIMAVLGARMLEEAMPGVEAAATVSLRQAGEQSVLANIADSCSEGLTRVLRWLAQWIGIQDVDSIEYQLNKDFFESKMDPGMIQALMGALQAGYISWNTWFYNIKRGELIPDEITMQEEAKLIEAGTPAGFTTPPLTPEEETALEVDKADQLAEVAAKHAPEPAA